MPFAVFRRHQRKLLAIFAILAMFGFVLADSLPRLLSPGYSGGSQNPVVVELYHKKFRRSDINEMAVQRNNANMFMATLAGRPIFGEINTRAIVDALILEHEANKLKMPSGPEMGREWLKKATNGLMNRDLFEATLGRFGNRVSGEQILSDIANQVRIVRARQLLGSPVVTPLDVYQAYRDQNERVGARIVALPIDDFLSKVSEPTAAEAEAYYNKYKDVLPDADRETPGFKIPRRVKVEILSLDGQALALAIKDKLTEAELRTYYENRKSDFKKPSELPDDIFAGDPHALRTPPLVQSFEEVRPYLTTSLAEDKAQAEIVSKFGKIKDEDMIPSADKYHDALDAINDARKQGEKTSAALPSIADLKDVAKKEGLSHEVSPLLTREQAEHFGEIASAEVGLTPLSGGRKFALEFFDPKTSLYEPVELTDINRRRFLVRKIDDQSPRVPPLDEIKSEVALAWKREKARPLAEKAAQDLADTIRKAKGKITGDTIDGRKVLTIPPITRLQPGFPLPGQFVSGPPTDTEIPQVDKPGPVLRDAYFDLEEGKVSVAPNLPRNIYYVLSLDRRVPATFATLYAPTGEYFRYKFEAEAQAGREREEEWMTRLRQEAGVPANWVPPDEAERESNASQG